LIGPIDLSAGTHQATLSVTGGDGVIEWDALRVAIRAPTDLRVTREAEDGSGEGEIVERGNASAGKTVRLRSRQSRVLRFDVQTQGRYQVVVRYSNDSDTQRPGEQVSVAWNQAVIGRFQAEATNLDIAGAGWNNFVSSQLQDPIDLPAGPAELTISTDGGDGLIEIDSVSLCQGGCLDVKPAQACAGVTAIVNGASFGKRARPTVAPGEIVALFGFALGPVEGAPCGLDGSRRVVTSCAGTTVRFDEIAAPMFFVRADQINAQVPYEVAGRTTVTVQVLSARSPASVFSVNIEPSDPGIFTYSAPDTRALILNGNNTMNSPENPAARGEIVSVFATGEGQTAPSGVTGRLCSAAALATPVLACGARIGGESAPPAYCGCAPDFAGLLQLNLPIPRSAASGALPLVITVGNNSSQSGVLVWVR
jgi:uncharacterized protein (TIGR03437 family)